MCQDQMPSLARIRTLICLQGQYTGTVKSQRARISSLRYRNKKSQDITADVEESKSHAADLTCLQSLLVYHSRTSWTSDILEDQDTKRMPLSFLQRRFGHACHTCCLNLTTACAASSTPFIEVYTCEWFCTCKCWGFSAILLYCITRC